MLQQHETLQITYDHELVLFGNFNEQLSKIEQTFQENEKVKTIDKPISSRRQ